MIIKTFKDYLEHKKLKARTINPHLKRLAVLLNWLAEQALLPKHVRIQDLEQFLSSIKKATWSNVPMNMYIATVKHYFDYLVVINAIKFSPAQLEYVPQKIKSYNAVPMDELEDLYMEFGTATNNKKTIKGKVILGLMVYQAAASMELNIMSIKHIDFNKCTVTIPSVGGSAERTLKLEAVQIESLKMLINQIDNANADSLLFANKDKHTHLSHILNELYVAVKPLNERVNSLHHLRACRIIHWIKVENDLLKVKYWAGFKKLNSLNRYENANLDAIKNELISFHPLA